MKMLRGSEKSARIGGSQRRKQLRACGLGSGANRTPLYLEIVRRCCFHHKNGSLSELFCHKEVRGVAESGTTFLVTFLADHPCAFM